MKQVKNIFNKVVLALPVATTASLAVVGAGLILLILSDSYSNLLISLVIILAGLPVFLYVTYKFNDNGPGSDREKLILSIFMLIFAAIWIIYNAPFAAQNVFIDRDPGIYTVAGKHLVNNSTTNVKVEKIFGNDSKILAHEGGFWPKANTEDSAIIQPQGAHLLPAFLSLGGKIGGDGLLFKVNIIIGGLAILAFFAFVRLFTKPRWAALASIILSFTMPFLYFSRDTYTEPLTLLFGFGGLAFLISLYSQLPKVNKFLWFLSGLTLGATGIARTDGNLILLAAALFFLIAIVFSDKYQRNIFTGFLNFLAGGAITLAISRFDVKELTIAYYNGPGGIIDKIIILLIFLATLIFLAYYFRSRIKKLLVRFSFLNKERLSLLLCFIVGATFIFLASRPLWMTKIPILKQLLDESPSGAHSNSVVQKLQGLPIANKNYSEYSIDWISWYVGGAIVLLALVGTMIAIYRVVHKKDMPVTLPLVFILASSFVYFIFPKISADHIWADRRFLPVIIPGFIFLAIYALSAIYEFFKENLKISYKHLSLLFIAVSAYLLITPILTSKPILINSEKPSTYYAISQLCEKLDPSYAVLWLDRSTLSLSAVQTTRSFCNVPSAGFLYGYKPKQNVVYPVDKSSLAKAAQTARAEGFTPVLAVEGERIKELDKSITDNLTNITSYRGMLLEKTLINPPGYLLGTENSILLGYIEKDGSITKY